LGAVLARRGAACDGLRGPGPCSAWYQEAG
jgi:hypothetical protein